MIHHTVRIAGTPILSFYFKEEMSIIHTNVHNTQFFILHS